jgi:hypothetical protein
VEILQASHLSAIVFFVIMTAVHSHLCQQKRSFLGVEVALGRAVEHGAGERCILMVVQVPGLGVVDWGGGCTVSRT